MEEVVTVDGRQFKLNTDRSLTAQEKAQVIAQIRSQTGCGTCGTRAMSGGAIYAMPSTTGTCTRTTVTSAPGNPVTLTANPNLGTAPYSVHFLGQFGVAPAALAGGGLTGANPQTVAVDGGTASVTYQLSDAEIVASGVGAPSAANVDGSGLSVPVGAANTVRFLVHTSDSCPTGILHCVEYCDVAIVCPTPTCNFVVT